MEEAGGGGVKVEEGEEGEGTFIWNQLTIGHTYVGTWYWPNIHLKQRLHIFSKGWMGQGRPR